jgi:hypothetical protein
MQGHYSGVWYVHTVLYLWRLVFRLSRWDERGYTGQGGSNRISYNVVIGWIRPDDEEEIENPNFQWSFHHE